MTDDEFLADVMQQNTYDLTREEFDRLVGLARKGACANAILEEAANKCDEHSHILRGAEKRFTDMGEIAMAENARLRAEQVEILAIEIRALSPALVKEGVVEELVERVALALFHSDKPFAKANNLIPTSNELEPWRYSARAAIAALPAPVSVQEQKT